MVNMENLITAGEFARLASTTKRTILFYDEAGVLKPARIGSNGYRLYEQRQVLEYQMILMLTSIGVTLDEIRSFLRNKGTLAVLFKRKKALLEKQLRMQQFNLAVISEKLENIEKNGTLVNPEVKKVSPFTIFYVEKVGPYVMLEHYGNELKNMLGGSRSKMVALTLFEDIGYRPKQCHMKVAVIARKGIRIPQKATNKVQRMTFDPGTIVTYVHRGPFETLSLSWKELERWVARTGYHARTNIPDYEIYHPNEDITKQYSEICLPVKPKRRS